MRAPHTCSPPILFLPLYLAPLLTLLADPAKDARLGWKAAYLVDRLSHFVTFQSVHKLLPVDPARSGVAICSGHFGILRRVMVLGAKVAAEGAVEDVSVRSVRKGRVGAAEGYENHFVP